MENLEKYRELKVAKVLAVIFLLPSLIQSIFLFGVCVGDDNPFAFCSSPFIAFILTIAPYAAVAGVICLLYVLWNNKKDENVTWKSKDISKWILTFLLLALLYYWIF